MFSSKTCKNFQNTFFTEHQWWLLLNNPNRILHFNKNNKVNYIKLNKHPKIFIMNITVSKASFWDFLIRKSNGKYSTFLNFIHLYLEQMDWIALLFYQFFDLQVRTGMNLVLVNILICHRGETILVLDFHQRNLL